VNGETTWRGDTGGQERSAIVRVIDQYAAVWRVGVERLLVL
jgi:hypothetical protein